MNNTGTLILGIMWILLSPLWFWAENSVMGFFWFCVGIIDLSFELLRGYNDKKSK